VRHGSGRPRRRGARMALCTALALLGAVAGGPLGTAVIFGSFLGFVDALLPRPGQHLSAADEGLRRLGEVKRRS
jgi:hypothetical protein